MSATTPFTTPSCSFRAWVVLLAALLCICCGNVLAQANNISYTSDMPSVERVKAAINAELFH